MRPTDFLIFNVVGWIFIPDTAYGLRYFISPTRFLSILESINHNNPMSDYHIAQLAQLEKLAERQIAILQRRVVDTEAAYLENSHRKNGGCSVLTGWEGYMDRKASDLVASNASKYKSTPDDRIFSRSSVLSDPSQNRIIPKESPANLSSSSSSTSSISKTTNNKTTKASVKATASAVVSTAAVSTAIAVPAVVPAIANPTLPTKTQVKAAVAVIPVIEEPVAVTSSRGRSRSRSSSRVRKTSVASDRVVGAKTKKSETGGGRKKRARKNSK